MFVLLWWKYWWGSNCLSPYAPIVAEEIRELERKKSEKKRELAICKVLMEVLVAIKRPILKEYYFYEY